MKSLFFLSTLLAWGLMTGLGRSESQEILNETNLGTRVRYANPDLQAARWRIREAMGRLKQSGRLANPEVEVGMEHDPRFREARVEVGWSQRFPLTDRLRREKELSLKEVEVAEAEVAEVERGLVVKARELWVKAMVLREERDLLARQKALAGEWEELMKKTVEEGLASELELSTLRLDQVRFELKAKQLDAAEVALLGELKPILGLAPEAAVRLEGRLARGIAAGTVRGKRADLEVLKAEVRAAGAAVRLEESRKWEDVEVTGFAAGERSEDVPEGYSKEAMVGVKLKVPLPWWNKNEGAVDEARATEQRKLAEVRALEGRIAAETATTRKEMERWEVLLGELDRRLLPMGRNHVETQEAAWKKGEASFADLLRSREKVMELESSRLEALREFHSARVRHEAALGNPNWKH